MRKGLRGAGGGGVTCAERETRKQNLILPWDGVTFPHHSNGPKGGQPQAGVGICCARRKLWGFCEWGGQKGHPDSGPPRAGSWLGEGEGTEHQAIVFGSESCVPGPGQTCSEGHMEREWLLWCGIQGQWHLA